MEDENRRRKHCADNNGATPESVKGPSDQILAQKYKKLKIEYQKKEKKVNDMKRYLQVLPTRDEFAKLKEEKQQLKGSVLK